MGIEGLAPKTLGTRTILNLVESRGGHFASGRRSNVSLIIRRATNALCLAIPCPLLHVATIRRETTKKASRENIPPKFDSRDNSARITFTFLLLP